MLLREDIHQQPIAAVIQVRAAHVRPTAVADGQLLRLRTIAAHTVGLALLRTMVADLIAVLRRAMAAGHTADPRLLAIAVRTADLLLPTEAVRTAVQHRHLPTVVEAEALTAARCRRMAAETAAGEPHPMAAEGVEAEPHLMVEAAEGVDTLQPLAKAQVEAARTTAAAKL